jgi:hypothetical protein
VHALLDEIARGQRDAALYELGTALDRDDQVRAALLVMRARRRGAARVGLRAGPPESPSVPDH